MNTVVQYSSLFGNPEINRTQCLTYLKEKNFARVIDVGASANSWAIEHLTHYFDINESKESNCIHGFIGNITNYNEWTPVIEDVHKHGKFDFAICTHTLEDICNPGLVCNMLSQIAKKGFIAVPSKYYELTRHEGQYRGWIHHRWIFNKEGTNIVAYPKLPFVDYIQNLDSISAQFDRNANGELQWYWQNGVDIKFINNDYLGPTANHVYSYYQNLHTD